MRVRDVIIFVILLATALTFLDILKRHQFQQEALIAIEMGVEHQALFAGKIKGIEGTLRIGTTKNIKVVSEPIALPYTTVRMVMVEKNGVSHPALVADPNMNDERIKSATSVKTVYYIQSGSSGYTSFFLIE